MTDKELMEFDFDCKIEEHIDKMCEDGKVDFEKLNLSFIAFWKLYREQTLKRNREESGTEIILGKSVYWEWFIDADNTSFECGGGYSEAEEYLFLLDKMAVYKWRSYCSY